MITIPVDEAYAFDVLTINEIKNKKIKNKNKYLFKLKNHIINQIGLLKFNKIITSREYQILFQANENTFQAVEKAKKNLISGYELDKNNTKRYKAKQKIQKKFFLKKLKEIKI